MGVVYFSGRPSQVMAGLDILLWEKMSRPVKFDALFTMAL